MKQKILAKLVAKYSGLSKEFLGLLATEMAKKVTEESGIDTAITELDNAPISIETLAAEFQKEGDRRVNDAKKEFTKNPPKPDKTEEPTKSTPSNDKPADDMPAWFKGWSEKQEQRIAAIEKDKVQGSMQARLKEKLKDIPEKFYARIPLPEKEEDFEAFVEGIQNDWNEISDGKIVDKLTNGTKPINGSAPPRGGQEKEASKEELDSVMKNIM